ncbi:MAG: NIL domain-containing protein [Thermodesulfobacteriota bacterium]
MMASPKQYSKFIVLHFAPEIARSPMMYNLARNFDLTFNILKARINPREEGHMILELSGAEDDFKRGVSYLQEHGISVQEVSQHISRDEKACMHCGVCTAMCMTKALYLDLESREVRFDSNKCTACGLCTIVCPVDAMHVEINDDL